MKHAILPWTTYRSTALPTAFGRSSNAEILPKRDHSSLTFTTRKKVSVHISTSQNSPYQILVSIEALKILYGILCSLLDELREIDLLFRIETDAQRPGRMDATTREFHHFSDDHLKDVIIPQHTKKISALQKSRRALQRLPRFPDADLVRALYDKEEDNV